MIGNEGFITGIRIYPLGVMEESRKSSWIWVWGRSSAVIGPLYLKLGKRAEVGGSPRDWITPAPHCPELHKTMACWWSRPSLTLDCLLPCPRGQQNHRRRSGGGQRSCGICLFPWQRGGQHIGSNVCKSCTGP